MGRSGLRCASSSSTQEERGGVRAPTSTDSSELFLLVLRSGQNQRRRKDVRLAAQRKGLSGSFRASAPEASHPMWSPAAEVGLIFWRCLDMFRFRWMNTVRFSIVSSACLATCKTTVERVNTMSNYPVRMSPAVHSSTKGKYAPNA